MAIQTITKIEAAERQLNTGVRMFFRGEDVLATHTVICAAQGVINDLSDAHGKKSTLASLMELIKPGKQKRMIDFFNNPQNFLKHADRDPDDILKYNPDVLEQYILITVNSFEILTGRNTPETKGFMIWFSMLHPQILNFSALKSHNQAYIEKWGKPDTTEDKTRMLSVIDMYRKKLSK